MEDVPRIAISLGALVFSVMFHEMAHAWSAWKMGDPTGKNDHRLSWNPVHHLDPFMSILLPLVTYFTMGFPFGGAKPVAINPLNFRNPGRGWMISAALGPLSNLLLATLSLGLLYLLAEKAPQTIVRKDDAGNYHATYNGYFFMILILTNVGLAAFNLIPIPPLDGSRVLRYLLPERSKGVLDRIEPFGIFVILLLASTRMFGTLFQPVWELLIRIMVSLFDAQTLSALFEPLLRR